CRDCFSFFFFCFFFFSSRRRHTRFSRDWSSDVCSSDLIGCIPTLKYLHRRAGASRFTALSASERARILGIGRYEYNEAASAVFRSEEHTSELQSREKLVCRLLLEKKNHLLLYTQ